MKSKRTAALTLVELIATLAIVSMLTVATLAVVSNLPRGEARRQRRHDELLLSAAVREVLTADLLHATQYRLTAKGFALRTHVALDAGTMARHHLAATVKYEVQEIGAGRWLVRRQRPGGSDRPGGSRAGGSDSAELVCSGAEAVSLEAFEDTGDAEENWQIVPAGVVVTVEFEDPARRPVEFTVVRDRLKVISPLEGRLAAAGSA